MFKTLLPISLRKYFEMSKRQRKHEIQMTLWYMPIVYILVALILVSVTLLLDLTFEINQYSYKVFQLSGSATRVLVSTLIGGILTLSAFTLNSLLVVLTTFSTQFSPRMLLNFVADKQTQHALGLFNGSFVYVLIIFLFIGNAENEYYVATPIITIILAFLTAVVFIYFINHATTWMQVHNITYTMKKSSENIINKTLRKELEDFRTKSPGDLMKEYQDEARTVRVKTSGYLQLVNYKSMLAEARKDNIVIQVQSLVGDYILKGNQLLKYWGPGAKKVNPEKYYRMMELGHKQTEIQDLNMGMNKLAEIAIRAIGNDDPKTATNTLHQMADLMLMVDRSVTFTPYLKDEDGRVRVILREDTFEYYIYRGFGYIRHYAKDNHLIITEIINTLTMVAESIDPSKHQPVWEFAYNTLEHMKGKLVYQLDQTFLLNPLYRLAEITGNETAYYVIKEQFYQNK